MSFRFHALITWSWINLLLLATVWYLLGNLAGFFYPGISFVVIYSVLSFLAVAFLLLRRFQDVSLALLLCLFWVTGYTLTSIHLSGPLDSEYIANQITSNSDVSVSGTLVGYPEYDGQRTRFIISAETLLIQDKQKHDSPLLRQTTHGRVRMTMAGTLPVGILPGDHLLLLASVDRVHKYLTPGSFDYRLYLADQSVRVTGWIRSPLLVIKVPGTHSSFVDKIRFFPERVRCRIAVFLRDHLDEKVVGLYQALLIGSRAAIDPAILEQFKATGCMHLLAISGMHMGLLALMLIGCITWLLKRSTWVLVHFQVSLVAVCLAMVPLIIYAFIAGFNMPVVRALTMTLVLVLALILRRQRSVVHVVAAAALIICIFRPLALFTVSFQLSFAAVMAISLIFPRISHLFFPLSSRVDTGSRDAPGIILFFASRMIGVFVVSIAATIGTLPFLLHSFNRFSPISPLVNLLIEPLLCLWALPLGLVAAPLIFIQPDIAEVLLRIGSWGLLLSDHLTAVFSRWPFASLWSVTPTFVEICIYYIAIILLYYRKHIRGGWLPGVVAAIFLVLLFSGKQYVARKYPANVSEVVFLDVGQGASVFIRLEDGTTALIDGGGSASPRFNVGSGVIAPFLWKKRIRRLDHLIITHADSDHYNGLDFIIRRFRPKRVWINGFRSEDKKYNQLLSLAMQKGSMVISPMPDDIIAETGESRFYCLGNPLRVNNMPSDISHDQANDDISPQGNRIVGRAFTGSIPQGLSVWPRVKGLSDNDLSLVFRLEHGKFSFLFTGDITKRVEHSLIRERDDLQTTVLQAAHHGSKTASSPEFIDLAKPRVILVSAGRYRGNYFPHPLHVKEWRKANIPFVVTAIQGATLCTTDGNTLQVETMTGKRFEW